MIKDENDEGEFLSTTEVTKYSEATKAAAGRYADATLMGDECWTDGHPDYARQLWLEAMNHLDEFHRTRGES